MDLTNNIEWKDGVSGNTPLMAENLNRINKGTKTALKELESETQAKVTTVQDSVTALKNGLGNGSVIVNKSNNDGEGNNIKSTYAKQNGTYNDLTAGTALKDDKGNAISSYYQPKLNFDTVPLDGSLNPVTSGGIKLYVDPSREICEAGNMTVKASLVSSFVNISNQFIIKTSVFLGGVSHQKIQYFGVISTDDYEVTLTCPDGFGSVYVNVSTTRTNTVDNMVDIEKIEFNGNKVKFTIHKIEGIGDFSTSFNFIITTIK